LGHGRDPLPHSVSPNRKGSRTLIDKTLGHYEVTAFLGKGGMGEVYRARDLKLGREVALKLLPPDFARDPERLARFRREARVLASLQHPNIASIFGLEEADGQMFLAMELAEGTDLSQRIQEGPVPEEEALEIGRQLAAGLEEAHERHVVHRDLKPANVKVSSEGKVKILDFGLARAFVGETSEEEALENSPTITAALTGGGVILGTAAYMSPEQARGKKVDRRADIWAFGVILFELLSGGRVFEGDTVSDTLAAVLRAPIEWDRLPKATSPGMRLLLERCLERDPRRRLRDVGEARIFLEEGAKDSSILAAPSLSGLSRAEGDTAGWRRGLPLWAAILGGLVLAVGGTALGWKVLGRPAPPRVLNLTVPPPPGGSFDLSGTDPGPVALSPDGTMMAYAARDASGPVTLHLRRLDSPEATVITGTTDAVYPFWSPDSRYIGFASDGKLKKVAVSGGPPVTLCPASNMKGGTWNRDDVILFAPDHKSGIHRVPASGGTAVEITTINTDEGENSHREPRFLPDGRRFLFLARMIPAKNDSNRVYIGSLDGSPPQMIATSEAQAEYSAGHLLTVREGVLLATPMDPGTGKLGPDGIPLVENILVLSGGAVCGVYSSTADGMLTYQISTGSAEQFLAWTGPSGTQLGRVGDPGQFRRPRVSPDGTQAVVEIVDPETETADLWLVDLDTGLRTRFTFDPGDELDAVWTPDGKSILYETQVDSTYGVVSRPVEGTGGATVLYQGNQEVSPSGMSPDGSTLMTYREDPDTGYNIYEMAVDTGKMKLLVGDKGLDAGAVVSPDGRWFAYFIHTATDNWEVIVRPMSGGDRQWQVDRDQGVYPFWGPDGKKLFYMDLSGDVMEVPVDGSGSTFRAGAPKLFAQVSSPVPGGVPVSLHPDGDRLLYVGGDVSEDEKGFLRLVTDWPRGLAK
jgi:Tol biopolymer transport system component